MVLDKYGPNSQTHVYRLNRNIMGCMHVCVFMALITTLVLCARSQDLVMLVSVRRVHVVLSTAGFKGGGKPCHKTREAAAMRRGIQKTSRT